MQAVDLSGLTIAVLGGDKRELELTRHLAGAHARVKALGFPPIPDCPGVLRTSSLSEALENADVVIAPMSNTDEHGTIKSVMDDNVSIVLDAEAFKQMPRGTVLFIGMAKPIIRDLAEAHGIRLIETAEIDEVAILNSIPTAEGAIMLAMQNLPITIHGAKALVIGFGRCGVSLARMLAGIGARTTVAARNPSQLARAEEMGLDTAHIADLKSAVADADVVFNTVPVLLVTRAVLEGMKRGTLVVDIASAPGGVDFAAAAELGIRAELALGLPGKVAPLTAGLILARAIPKVIREVLPHRFQPTSEPN